VDALAFHMMHEEQNPSEGLAGTLMEKAKNLTEEKKNTNDYFNCL
jgi:hypothetical protein